MNYGSVAFHHFGCKVNFAEASSLAGKFREEGIEMVDFHEKADVYVISTCVVTAVAEKKCRAAIRQAHKLNPNAKIAVIGCFPELKPDELQQMEGVDLVLGHSAKFGLLEELQKLDNQKAGISGEHPAETHEIPCHTGHPLSEAFIPSWSIGDRTRSFLKIQDGCDYFCTYCTIPLVRGRSRSDTIENVLNNARAIIQSGSKEIILTGVNIGDFGRQNGESLADLIRELDKLRGISRIRISSIEPDLLTDEIIELIATSNNFLPHFHIPLQSGCDRILKAMHRRYNRELYRSRVEKIRSLMPYSCIAADVIVGFPGETDAEFGDTHSFLESLEISYMHVFPYSKRANTLAAGITDTVTGQARKERSDMLHRLSEEKKRRFYQLNQGSEAEVLFESDNTNGFMHGFTRNYVRVRTPFNPALVNTVQQVMLDKMAGGGYDVEVVEERIKD